MIKAASAVLFSLFCALVFASAGPSSADTPATAPTPDPGASAQSSSAAPSDPKKAAQATAPMSGTPAKPPPPAGADSAATDRAPVIFAKTTLFELAGAPGRSAESRARRLMARLTELAKKGIDPDSVKSAERSASTDVVTGDAALMSVTIHDAEPTGRTRSQLAADYALRIREGLHQELQDRSTKSILLGVLYALLATGVLIGLFALARRLFPKLYDWVKAAQGTRIKAIRLQRITLLSAERLTSVALAFARLLRLVVSVTIVAVYLSFVFKLFPWTRGLGDVLYGLVASGLKSVWSGIAAYAPSLFYITIIAVVTLYILKFVRFIATQIENGTVRFKSFPAEWAGPTYKIMRFVLLALAMVVAVPYLPGSKSPAFQGISIFLGVLFSLGSTSAISNVVAGIVITYMRPFRLGDRVRIASTTGDVVEKNLLVTRVRTIRNVEVTIPNSMVLGSHIVNFTSTTQRADTDNLILTCTVTLEGAIAFERVNEVLTQAVLGTVNVAPRPPPFVLQGGLDGTKAKYTLNAYTTAPNEAARTYSELHGRIRAACAQAELPLVAVTMPSGAEDGKASRRNQG